MSALVPVRRLVAPAVAGLGALLSPSPAAAQFQDGELPARGQFWLEVTPGLENWAEQFALDSPTGLMNGEREPLFADFGGPLGDRHFPAEAIRTGLNEDGPALGFEPLTAEEFSMGRLEFGTMNAQVRRLELGLQYGLLNRLALEVRAPVVLTEMELAFGFDSLAATVVPGQSVVPFFESFFSDFGSALASLDALVAGGTLPPGEQAMAELLLAGSGAFGEALERRVRGNQVLPLGESRAGDELAARYAELSAGYAALDLALPELTLSTGATASDLEGFFAGEPVQGLPLRSTRRGWGVAEIEVGARFAIFDSWRALADEARPDAAAAGGVGPADAAGGQPAGAGATQPRQAAPALRKLRLRTAVGVRGRIPIRPANDATLYDPTDFVGLPIADGQPDVEVALYQDVAFGRRLWLSAAGRYGVQLADELVLRVRSPDRPYALASTESLVRRDLGDYFSLRLAPQFRLNEVLSLGIEYGYWRKGSDSYELVTTTGDVTDVSPLEVETSQTRHRLGIGAFYRLAEATDRESRRPPWVFGFIYQSAIAGSGGQTPTAQLVTFTLRAPMQIF